MTKPRAICLIQDAPHYRRDAFESGLKRCGFTIGDRRFIDLPDPGHDLLVIWNRYGIGELVAGKFGKVGAAVIVVENGYLGASENSHAKPFINRTQEPEAQLYALALNYHNGAGDWFIGEPGRWKKQGIQVEPWRSNGQHVLMLPQRGIGSPGVAMPIEWPERAKHRVLALTEREVRARVHPGNAPAPRPLQEDLEGCWCAVTWGSGAALKAICAGVPVFHDFDKWIGRPSSLMLHNDSDLDEPLVDDFSREEMLDRLAWAQWTVSEISTGEPIMRLLELHRDRSGH